MLTFDHVFACVDVDPPEPEALRARGFTVDFGREHPGQGTRNRLVLFPDHYLELMWLTSRAEAESAMVRLDRRVDWRTTGACPFGVALRGERPEVDPTPWVRYQLDAFPVALWVDRRTLDDPRLPLVFTFDRPDQAEGGPRHGGYPRRLLEHPGGATGIERIVIEGPGLDDAPALPLPPMVTLRRGPAPRLHLTLRGRRPGAPLSIGALLRLD